ncbi:PaaI family thioesterase [Spirillospora sp. NPDC047279]|uniref:PaaI family thioesterase n=1 Tax=Spirillospora sp. NPDC047279 TaxID=3155478 RepID=UPI0034106740
MINNSDDLAELGRELGATHRGLDDRMGIELLEAGPERVVARMPVAPNTQAYGTLHGGASCVLAETTASLGAAIHAGQGRMALGIEINASHHRPASSGHVTAVATKVSAGRNLATYDVSITDDEGRAVCTARVTSMLRDRPGS